MLSSVQIAQIMQQQNASFMGAAQHAQSISQQMPQPYGGGLGAYGGMGGGGGPQFPQIPLSGNNQRSGFNYGMPYGQGYGMGNDFASRMMSTGGGITSAGIGVAGAIAGMGSMGMALGAMPVAAFGKHAISGMVAGAQEQSNVNRVVGQMDFMNPASRTGRGFSRQDAQSIGSTIREMQHLPEAMTSMGELTRIMDKVIQTGQMQGVRDPHDFQRKFKATVKTLKDVAQVMGTTMEEAVPLLQEARQAGHYGATGAKTFSMQRQVTQSLTGMNQQQVNQTAQYGAQIGFQTGGSRRTGAAHALRSTGQIGMMLEGGHLTTEEIEEHTGKAGADGIQDMGLEMQQLAHRMARSSIGTIMTVGLGEQKGGRYTGKMDKSLVNKLTSGRMTFDESMRLGRSKISGRGAKISYVARKNQMFSEMAGETGMEGIALQLEGAIGNRFGDDEDVQNIIRHRFGMSEKQAELASKIMKQAPQMFAEKAMREANQAEQTIRQSELQKFSPDAMKRKIAKKMENIFTEPFKEMGVGMYKSLQDGVDGFIDRLTGNFRTEFTKTARGAIYGARSGDKLSQAVMGDYQRHGQVPMGTGANLGREGGIEGLLQRGLGALGGGSPSGTSTMNYLSQLAGGTFMGKRRSFEGKLRGNFGTDVANQLRRLTTGSGQATPQDAYETDAVRRKGERLLDPDTVTSDAEMAQGAEYAKGMAGEGDSGRMGRDLAEQMKATGGVMVRAPSHSGRLGGAVSGGEMQKMDAFKVAQHGLSKAMRRKEFLAEKDTNKRMEMLVKEAEHDGGGEYQRAIKELTSRHKISTTEAALVLAGDMGMGKLIGFNGFGAAGNTKAEVSSFLQEKEQDVREGFRDAAGGKAGAEEMLGMAKSFDTSLFGLLHGSQKGKGWASTFRENVAGHRAPKAGFKGAAFTGTEEAGGYLSPEQQKLMETLARLPGNKDNLSAEELKTLFDARIDPSTLTHDQIGKLSSVATAFKNGTVKSIEDTMSVIHGHIRMGELMTADEKVKIAGRFTRSVGTGATARVKALLSGSGAGSDEAKKVVAGLSKYAEGGTGAEGELGSAARRLVEMRSSRKKGVRKAADVLSESGNAELDAASAYYGGAIKRMRGMERKLKNKKGGLDLEDIGMVRGAEGSEQERIYMSAQAKLGPGGKITGRKQAEEMQAAIAGEQGRLKAGGVAGNKNVDEAKVADALQKYLTTNTEAIKSIVANMPKAP